MVETLRPPLSRMRAPSQALARSLGMGTLVAPGMPSARALSLATTRSCISAAAALVKVMASRLCQSKGSPAGALRQAMPRFDEPEQAFRSSRKRSVSS